MGEQIWPGGPALQLTVQRKETRITRNTDEWPKPGFWGKAYGKWGTFPMPNTRLCGKYGNNHTCRGRQKKTKQGDGDASSLLPSST